MRANRQTLEQFMDLPLHRQVVTSELYEWGRDLHKPTSPLTTERTVFAAAAASHAALATPGAQPAALERLIELWAKDDGR